MKERGNFLEWESSREGLEGGARNAIGLELPGSSVLALRVAGQDAPLPLFSSKAATPLYLNAGHPDHPFMSTNLQHNTWRDIKEITKSL